MLKKYRAVAGGKNPENREKSSQCSGDSYLGALDSESLSCVKSREPG